MNDVEIYTAKDGKAQIEVRFENETVWLSLNQLAQLFGRDKSVISRHLKRIFEDRELSRKSVVAKNATTAADGKTYEVECFNLDVIISVGYRVNSKRGTQFRQWATQRLRDYLVKGYAINEKRLKASQQQLTDLKKSLSLLENVVKQKQLSTDEAVGLLKVVAAYSHALDLLDQYDHQQLQVPQAKKASVKKLTYVEAIKQIGLWRKQQNAGKLFGNEKDESFQSSLQTIYQTFGGKDLYPSLHEKAANLLYFVVKNHSFTDGNKRIAAGLFLYFLDKNKQLYATDGSKIIADNTLVAITIMIAESNPDDKEMMIKLIVNLMVND
ncbi:MAG: virulence RhuM family protein [Flammeovirgaceae bacterium]|jgi:prophage maintenance system killer protein|nr:virulence RhuM family protein [Flammeovirgaceae bacterium]